MQPKERRQQILERARDVFAKKGYYSAKIDDIVLAAGVARGTFYLYFEDKKSIFEELIQLFFQRIALAVRRIDTDSPVEPQIRSNIRDMVDVLLSDRAMTKILLLNASGVDAVFDQKLHSFYNNVDSFLEQSLLDGQARGLVKPGNVRLLGDFMIGGVKEMMLRYVRDDAASLPDPDALVQHIYAILADGILIHQSS